MSNPDFIEFSKIVMALAGNFQATLDPNTIDFWFESFRVDNISIDQIKTAARQILRERTSDKSYKTMPNYADFIKIIEGSLQNKAQQQASLVLEKLNFAEYNYKFADPVTDYLMSRRWPFHTWGKNVLEKELEFWPKKFIEAYIAFDPKRENLAIEYGDNLKQLTKNIGVIE